MDPDKLIPGQKYVWHGRQGDKIVEYSHRDGDYWVFLKDGEIEDYFHRTALDYTEPVLEV